MSSSSSLWKETPPPTAGEPYIIPQLSGERLTIPGSKGAFRILASSKQTNGLMAVFQSGAVLSDAPGFHYHDEAHDVFLVTKGYLKLWNGPKCRVMGPGDFAYVPPGVIHNPELLGPHTETYGVVTPGDWIDFFRYISEPYEGILVPESDDRDLKALLIPKVMAAKGQFDVVFQPHYVPPELGEWDASDEVLPTPENGKLKEYYLRANTGPRFMLGGVLSRPFITTKQSGGVVAISSIESSADYGSDANVLGRFMTFEKVDHCLAVLEGTLVVRLRRDSGEVEEEVIREGETVVVPSGQAFALEFRSRYVRVWSFADGDGIEALIEQAGSAFSGVILPESVDNGSCHACLPLARGLMNPQGRSGPVPRKPAIGVVRRSTSVMSFIRARIVRDLEKKIEELNAQLQAAESKLSPNDEPPQINATPSSLPMSIDRPTLTPTSSKLPEEPEGSYDADQNDQQEETDPVDDEITEINHHTNGIEFHGSTSSVALLGHLQKARDQPDTSSRWGLASDRNSRRLPPAYSIVSTLHNASFSPSAHAHANTPQSLSAVHENNYYFEQAHVFMSGYFENVHFIHPFIDKEDFRLRAHDLWMRRTPTPDPSFIALYLAVLSFGALLRVWDEATLGGLTRFEWSRKLFGEAQMYLNYLHFPNNLDAVQCLYLMAKICQNELNPNLAYMYLGLAVRTCLAAGFNRNVRTSSDPRAEWISKTEMSFSLGRPDTLGLDDYHNRPLPPRDTSQHAIIPWMVDFARITRKVSVQIYHRRLSLQEKLNVALAIEAELEAWMAGLPGWIRPGFISDAIAGGNGGNGGDRNDLKDPKWARRQRLVLGIRYYNVKTLLFRPFLRHCTALEARARAGDRAIMGLPLPPPLSTQTPTRPDPTDAEKELEKEREISSNLAQTITKCLDAARNTISVIHDIYRVHTFFRCWWYNTTYVTFAVSTLLLPLLHPVTVPQANTSSTSAPTSTSTTGLGLKQEGPTDPTSGPGLGLGPEKEKEKEPITTSIEKAIAILEATDESVVTRKCAELIRFYLREVQSRDAHSSDPSSTSRERDRERDRMGGGVVSGFSEAAAAGSTWFGNPGAGAGNGNGGGFGNPTYGSSHSHSHAHDGPMGLGFDFGHPHGPAGLNGNGNGDWAYGFGFPDSSFEGIARFFDDLGGLPILDE
ncbi:uncharacterized protein BDV14DRAFT_189940 [Aspergillus stella-maris]|uniref:uncharacterized protein n=1 Tax=Aspergillus stella-maris TaxID=1810926 RepID=UPI003CCD4281